MSIELGELQSRHQTEPPKIALADKLGVLRAKYGDAYVPFLEARTGPISFTELQTRVDDALPYAQKAVKEVLAELMYTGRNLGQMESVRWDEEKQTETMYFALISAYYGTRAPAHKIMDAFEGEFTFDKNNVVGEIEYFLRENLRSAKYINEPLHNRYPADMKLRVKRVKIKDRIERPVIDSSIHRLRRNDLKDLAYEGEELRHPDYVFWKLKDQYKATVDEILDIDDHVFSYGWHGIGKSQQMIPELYEEAEERGFDIPVMLKGANLHKKDMEERKMNPAFQGYEIRHAYNKWKDTFGGDTKAYLASLYENGNTEKPKILVFDEVVQLASDKISLRKPEETAPEEYAGFLKQLAAQNVRLITILAYPVDMDPEKLSVALNTSSDTFEQAGLPMEKYYIKPAYITPEVAENAFISLGVDKELIHLIANSENDVLRHPRMFSSMLFWAWQGRRNLNENEGRRLNTIDDLKFFLIATSNDPMMGMFGDTSLFSPKLSIHYDDLVQLYVDLGIELSEKQLQKIEEGRKDLKHITIVGVLM